MELKKEIREKQPNANAKVQPDLKKDGVDPVEKHIGKPPVRHVSAWQNYSGGWKKE